MECNTVKSLACGDTLDAIAEKCPRCLRSFIATENYETITRAVLHNASVYDTVTERFALEDVIDCAKIGKYRPEALRGHDKFKQFYPTLPPVAAGAPLSKSEEPTLPTQLELAKHYFGQCLPALAGTSMDPTS